MGGSVPKVTKIAQKLPNQSLQERSGRYIDLCTHFLVRFNFLTSLIDTVSYCSLQEISVMGNKKSCNGYSL